MEGLPNETDVQYTKHKPLEAIPDLLTEQEKKDLNVGTIRKKWVTYWIKRLATETSTLPNNIRVILEQKKDMQHIVLKLRDVNSLFDYVTDRIIDLKKKAGILEIVLDTTEDSVVTVEADNLEQNLQDADIANCAIVEHTLPNVASKQEKRDLAMNTSQKGWTKYWLKRLVPEIDILPTNISRAVSTYLTTGKIINIATLPSYINKRISILQFQIQKREKMARLKKELRRVDAREDLPEHEKKQRKAISYDHEVESLFVIERGNKKIFTIGDIIGDLEWGIKYYPDESVPYAIWRKIRKLSALKETRTELEEIFNIEISQMEKISLPTTVYKVKDIEAHLAHIGIHGVVAERMIQSVLVRIAYNHPELNLKIEHSNAVEDSELKYDFKIVIPIKARGVAIEGNSLPREDYKQEKKRIGIQFTVTRKPSNISKKRKQVEDAKQRLTDLPYRNYIKRQVDDIVLISVSLNSYINCFRKWISEGKPSGGPEQYLTSEEKAYFLKTALNGLVDLSDEEIEKLANE